MTDHHPLCKILGVSRVYPLWLQHECRGGPSPLVHISILLNISMVQLTTVLIACQGCHCLGRHQIVLRRFMWLLDDMPVTATQIAKESKRDKELSIVLKSIQHGHWPSDTAVTLSPFRKRYTELSVLDGCNLWGSRAVIPSAFCQSLLQELHTTYFGMRRMKSLARSYVWWPGLDAQIEKVCRACVGCCAANRNPPKAPAHPWMIPQHPWQRVHVDHAHFGGRLLLVAVDVYSKCPEVHIVSSTSAQQTISKLCQIFACHGLPVTLVSDNGSPFQSTEFQQFVAANGILHRIVPPYHPSSNGLAENMVKTVKHALSKAKVTKDATLDTSFLATYRNT